MLGPDEDRVTLRAAVLQQMPEIAALLDSAEDDERTKRLRRAESIGRPIGSDEWLAALEQKSGRTFKPGKRGRKAEELNALSP